MQCPHCGVTNQPDAARCTFCGERFPLTHQQRRQLAVRAGLAIVIPAVIYQLFTWLFP